MSGLRALRACMVCSVVQPQSKFNREGCPNCEEFLELRGNPDAIADCTSQVFEGLITVTDPEHSWVAKFQRLEGYKPGTYAVKVVGMVCLVDHTYSICERSLTVATAARRLPSGGGECWS